MIVSLKVNLIVFHLVYNFLEGDLKNEYEKNIYITLFIIIYDSFLGTLYVRADSNRILANEGKVEEASLYVPDAIQSLFQKNCQG